MRPAAATLLYLLDGGRGSATELCDGARAHDSLDDALRARLSRLRLMAEHDSAHNAGTRAATPAADGTAGSAGSDGAGEAGGGPRRRRTAVHPLLRSHPLTGRVSLYASPLYTRRLLAPPGADSSALPAAEAAEMLSALLAHLPSEAGGGCAPFRWAAPGDLLLIDNARMLHRATTRHMAVGERRKMLRISIVGGHPEPPSGGPPARGAAAARNPVADGAAQRSSRRLDLQK